MRAKGFLPTFPNFFSKLPYLILVGLALLEQPFGMDPASAQTEPSKSNPLEISVRDPLLPRIDRPLTPFEIRRLREALEGLNLEARGELEVGNEDAAFEIWYRELRLRREIGRLEEIQALGRVGEIAWDKMRTEEVTNITKRLTDIQKEAESEAPLTPDLLKAFAGSYQQVHATDNSINIYQKNLANARQKKNDKVEEATLKILGQLYLDKFDYSSAAPIYEGLLSRSQARRNVFEEGIYLQKLAEIYGKLSLPENSVKAKENLAENYLTNRKIESIPELKISIGIDYETLKQAEQASQNYQEAFSLAWALQQYGAAGEALKKLGNLYQTYHQDAYALKIFQELVKVQQQSYNYYGLMEAYDRIGQIHLKQGQYPQALDAFQQGLALARTLSHQEDYFLNQIGQVNRQIQGGGDS